MFSCFSYSLYIFFYITLEEVITFDGLRTQQLTLNQLKEKASCTKLFKG